MSVADLGGLAASELLQGVRQLGRLWHARPIDQNRDDTNVAGKRRRDLDRHKIVRIVEPAPAALVLRIQPVGTDDDQKDIAPSHLAVQMRHKVGPDRNVVDIYEEIVVAECLREPVVQATGHAD